MAAEWSAGWSVRLRRFLGWDRLAGVAALLARFGLRRASASPPRTPRRAPALLRDTGLYADFARLEVDPQNLAFAPQYPLWTDGAAKRRWISLPAGTAIDACDPEAWVFPVGHAVLEGVRLRRPAGRDPDDRAPAGRDVALRRLCLERRRARGDAGARRGPARRLRLRRRAVAPIPASATARSATRGGRTPILGFSLLQLSPDRDPDALHAEPQPAPGVDLAYLVRAGLLVGPAGIAARRRRRGSPRASPIERAALGYLQRQLRPLPQRRRQAAERRPLPAPRDRRRRWSRHGDDGRPADQGPGARARRPDAVLGSTPGHPERSGLAAAHGLALGGAADAAARHRAGGRGGARPGPAAGSPSSKDHKPQTQQGRDESNETKPQDALRGGRAGSRRGRRWPRTATPRSASTWSTPPGATTATPPGSWGRTVRSPT